MLSHHAVSGWLDAYADSTLPESERANVAEHLQSCAGCRERLRQIRRFDDVLKDLPAGAPVPFLQFWSKLEPQLLGHARRRAPLFQPARVAVGFALAVLACGVGVVALASDGVMPDSPLYAVKHLRQDI
ncbi:MAG: zf-HC2 domain-containing protein [Candidatus Dormibacteraeota bacterium]|nr:zf-HC2 domain-containing protein [Candidatus Dormibacteraeota bacterium]